MKHNCFKMIRGGRAGNKEHPSGRKGVIMEGKAALPAGVGNLLADYGSILVNTYMDAAPAFGGLHNNGYRLVAAPLESVGFTGGLSDEVFP